MQPCGSTQEDARPSTSILTLTNQAQRLPRALPPPTYGGTTHVIFVSLVHADDVQFWPATETTCLEEASCVVPKFLPVMVMVKPPFKGITGLPLTPSRENSLAIVARDSEACKERMMGEL